MQTTSRETRAARTRCAPFGRVTCARWLALGTLLWLAPLTAFAYGPLGHRIAGLAAEPLLCAAARDEIRLLAGDVSLGELGLWADRVRSYPAYADSAPWHYMNIADTQSLDDYVHPPEGDVLSAIERFSAILADRTRPRAERHDALRFLVHFVVDLHQPLHVGRASDRGGNTIELQFRGEETNLHRFWDTHAIALDGRPVDAYARGLLARAGLGTGIDWRIGGGPDSGDPVAWARESLTLRRDVYAFPARDRVDGPYLRRAERITERRLALAAWRLAGTLNRLLC